jgi:putative spermidine/putrescine transport system ATP-binding protein
VAAPSRLVEGAKARWSLRPERLVLDPTDPSFVRLKGTVQTVSFLGSVLRTTVAVGDQSLTVDAFADPRSAQPRVGTEVTVGWAPDAGWLEA